jgi:hypothetical protein
MLDKWYFAIKAKKGAGEAGRAMKTWRALYNVLADMKLCAKGQDPSLSIRRESVAGRVETWSEGEAVRLVKQAWREGYQGLACIIAVAWDTGFSPVDVRTLAQSNAVALGGSWGFRVERTKTGEAALGTLSTRTRKLVEAYVAQLGFDLHDDAPIFRTRGLPQSTSKGGRPRLGVPYTSDTLGDDFRDLRRAVFGPTETRKLLDMRRSGAVESLAGGASAEAISAKLANSLDKNKELQRTYLPVDPATIQTVDEARKRGRHLLRGEQKVDKKLKLADMKS